MQSKNKVLIGSPIYQDSKILKEFLRSLHQLKKEHICLDYFFIDDNVDKISKELLKDFSNLNIDSKVIIQDGSNGGDYICDENTHHWKENTIWKVANYKNKIINYCKENKYDYLFLIDSDIVLRPQTLNHLISSQKDIISEVFWTNWTPGTIKMPQVWLYDEYSQLERRRHENLDQEESSKRFYNFIDILKKPGIYAVGGLGACTLISKKAIEAGVNFSEIYNLSFWGEDRHFCIRAAALGLELFVDTHYPAYHIYRISDLQGIRTYKKLQKDSLAFQYFYYTDLYHILNTFSHNYLSYNYHNLSNINMDYLSQGYVDRTNSIRESIIRYITENKIQSTIIPLDIEIDENATTEGVVKAKVNLLLKVVTSKGEKCKKITCKIILNRNGESWIITHLSFYNEHGENILGFTIEDILRAKVRVNKATDNKVTLMMLIRNEADNFLKKILSHATQYIDCAVILDDASEDNTVEICKEVLKDIPHQIVSNNTSMFQNEIVLRKQLWEMTINTNPDWILCLDADEIFEDRIIYLMNDLINQPSFDYYSFRLYDMWDETHYREDGYWRAHEFYRIFLTRYQPNFKYEWLDTPQHCGRFPANIHELKGCFCYTKLKHYGWSTEALRKRKYDRYMKLDPEGKYGIMDQYRSILDTNPNLIEFK